MQGLEEAGVAPSAATASALLKAAAHAGDLLAAETWWLGQG